MKKYFVSSDIHSFYDEWMSSLNESGFDINNPEHILIVCGDIFDRGTKPLEVYEFLKNLPKERRILIKGNHEYLLNELVARGFELSHDIHNGTYDTLCYIAKLPDRITFSHREYLKRSQYIYGTDSYKEYLEELRKKEEAREHKLYTNRKLKQILKWINSDEWVNYYELGKYIFVHAFIPLREKMIEMDNALWPTGEKYYFKNWRTGTSDYEWEEATWGCPWSDYEKGFFKKEELNGKVLVCGHWHTSDFWNSLDYSTDRSKQLAQDNNPIYKSDAFPGLIGLDTCTALSHKVNVLVIEESDI